jgi:glycosyltransferase involved in cell wall biosynthesis
MTKTVPIVIPSYEPNERLIKLLNELNEAGLGPIIIVNDGSGTEYDEIFAQAEKLIEGNGGKLIAYRPNKGKGRALKTAFTYIAENMPDVLGCVTADSDGQHTPGCIASIIDKLREEPDKLILGVRRFDGEDIPWKSRFGNNLTVKVFSYVSGTKVTDTQTGLRGLPFDFMKDMIDCKGERFEYETQMLLECTGRIKISEVPIKTVYDSKDNHQTHFDPFKDSIRIYRILGKKFIKYIFASLTSFVIDILLFTLFNYLFKDIIPEMYLIQFSTICARVISATYNYTVNSDGTTDYYMDDNWLLKNLVWTPAQIDTLASSLVDKLKKVKWFPFEMWAAGLPYLETGDELEITTKSGTYTSYILQRQLQGIHNLQDTYINGQLDIF